MSLDAMLAKCSGVSTDFSTIVPGELLWNNGHVGVYIGDGLAVECTTKWENNVQISAVNNVGTVDGYNSRTWTKHGKLPWIDYDSFLDKGDSGRDVEILQKYLTMFGFDCGEIDGSFGPTTQKAVKEYQKSRGYEETGAVTVELFEQIEQEYLDMVFDAKDEPVEITEDVKNGIIVEVLEYIINALQSVVDNLKK